jgi:hypothetical protein
MAVEKVRGMDETLDWRWWLTAHSDTHGLAVSLLTGIPLLGLAEWILHALIDWLKSRLMLSLLLDQSLHVCCKIAWTYAVIPLG